MLKIDWASYEAAKYACVNWHYSGSLPTGKLVKCGVWEDDKFIGVVIFSRGANIGLANPYGLTTYESCELTRVALSSHKAFVSEILIKAIKKLKELCPNIRLIISYANQEQGHLGKIYQATNWIYDGMTDYKLVYLLHGKRYHYKSIYAKWGNCNLEWLHKHYNKDLQVIKTPPKFRYLYPLDKKMRRQLLPLAKPYPKKEVIT